MFFFMFILLVKKVFLCIYLILPTKQHTIYNLLLFIIYENNQTLTKTYINFSNSPEFFLYRGNFSVLFFILIVTIFLISSTQNIVEDNIIIPTNSFKDKDSVLNIC